MRQNARSRYQNTTLRMPQHIYERAKSALGRSSDTSFNEFVLEAIEEKLHRLSEAEIDAAFAQMAEDRDHQEDSVKQAREFEKSDWEALKMMENEQTGKRPSAELASERQDMPSRMESKHYARSSKARSR